MVKPASLMPAERGFYTTQTAMSAPGESAKLLDSLPADPAGVARVVSRLVIHPVALPPGEAHQSADARDAEAREARELLRRLLARNPAALDVGRAVEQRVVGTCRHYALLATTIFRHHGTPARVRVGFARYFVPGFYEDHWLCEYFDGRDGGSSTPSSARRPSPPDLRSTSRRRTSPAIAFSVRATSGVACGVERSTPSRAVCRSSRPCAVRGSWPPASCATWPP